jgi:hypothetical protein
MEPKTPCPTHGIRHIKLKGPYGGNHGGYWHTCTQCQFKKWVQINLFIIAAGAVSIGIYVQNVLLYTRLI